jgi:cyclophilin family peptidyl-prolyl cis-trans isomerase
MTLLNTNQISRIFGLFSWATLLGLSLSAASHATAENGLTIRAEFSATASLPPSAATSLTAGGKFPQSVDAFAVKRPGSSALAAASVSALRASADDSGPVPGDVSSITVAPTGLSAHQAIPAVNLISSGVTATVDLSSHFSFPGLNGTLVEFDTVFGTFAVELYGDDAPINVALFLQHVNSGAYTNTFIHRSVPNFVIQGGGYYNDFDLPPVTPLGTAQLEYLKPNYRGTLAMARGSDPGSAANQWFINTVDNEEILKPLGEGREGYTVIGRVLGAGLAVVDQLAGLPTFILSASFNEFPLYNYVVGNSVTFGNLVSVSGIAEVALYPTSEHPDALMIFTASSSNEAAVRTSISGSTLTFTSVGLGSANVTVRATESAGDWVEQQFTVTVSTLPSIVRQPTSGVFVEGTHASFEVQVSGTEPFEYQWMKDGQPISALGNVAGVHTESLTVFDVSATAVGSYSVTITNSAGVVVSAAAELTIVDQLVTHDTPGNGYTSGGIVQIDGVLILAGDPTSVKWSVLLPEGWTYASASGPTLASSPIAGDAGLLEFSWSSFPSPEFTFSFFLNVPTDATGEASFVGMATISRAEDTEILAAPDPLVIPLAVHHTADTDGDFKVGLSELLRVIELYNTRSGSTRTGAYRDINGSIDDFMSDTRAATASITLLRYHSADTDQDAKLSLHELLRVIELYNTRSGSSRTGKYRQSEGTIDGFTTDPELQRGQTDDI